MTIGIMRGIISLLLLIPTNGDPKGHPPPGAPAADPPAYVAGEIILELSDGGADALRSRLSGSPGASDTGHPTLDALGRRYGVRQIRAVLPDDRARGRKGPRPRMSDFFLLRLAEGQDALEALDEYRADPLVESVQLNYLYEPDLIPNDPLYPSQYAHAKTQAAAGWDIETGDPAVVIAIMGTGVSATHPDLAYRLVTGWDFVDDDTDPSPAGDGHETSVAGVAGAAANNLTGVAGVCWGCGLMPLRIDYTTTDVAQAIDFAVANGARVVNMSFGNYDINKYGPDTVVETAVDDGFAAGVVMVATAGNDAISTKRYPGALDNVIGVSSTDAMDERAGFSNFGDWVDVAAPGQAVYSTLLNGGFGTVNGTSFSAPYVAGLAGLVLSKDPLLTPSQVRLIVEYTTDPLDADRYIGTGRVNVARALAQNGVPQLFALIKSPVDGDLSPGPVDVFGTVLGDGFILEYRPQGEASWTAFAAGSQTIDGLLGTLPTGALAEGTYEIRLTAAHGSDQAEDIVAFYLGGAVQEGWPVNVGSAISSPLSYADLDGDGLPEILVGGTNTLVHVFRHDGTYFPGWPRSTSGIVFSSPSVGDIDGDGDPEVVVTTYLGAMLYAWHHDGTGVSGFPVAVGSGPTAYMRGSACLVNLDADPALEIIAAASDGQVHVFESPGATEMAGWPRSVSSNVQTSPAAGDLDGDGSMEIIIRQWEETFVLNADGTPVPGWPRLGPDGHVSPVIGDLDGDGTVEFVDAGGSLVTLWKGDGTQLMRTQIPETLSYSDLSLGDVDADGDLEIFVGGDGGNVIGLHHTGQPISGWPVFAAPEATTTPLVADIDGDGAKEILIGSTDGRLYPFNADGSRALGVFNLLSSIERGPAVADLDNDGDVELIAATVGGALQVYDMTGSWLPASADWPMYQADARHTGHHRFNLRYGDDDGDGEINLTDCAPQDPAIHHGAVEVCNGVDDDCDGDLQEDDPDGDGFLGCADDCDPHDGSVYPMATQLCDGVHNDCLDPLWPAVPAAEADADADGVLICGGDCDDAQAAVFPGAPQVCDAFNNDCLDAQWPAVGPEEIDGDGDGHRLCSGECDDSRAAVYPGAPQICDGLNNDCLAPGWPSLTGSNEVDGDGDGVSTCLADCDDSEPAVYPGAPEVCDGLNNDCLHPLWPEWSAVEPDLDFDGVAGCSDCDDSRMSVHPGAPQLCDGLNNDCNDPAWPALPAGERDDDGDGLKGCQGDCDDGSDAVYPGAAQVCDGLNNNCFHASWPSPAGTNEADDDGDGLSECQQDCNDEDAGVWSVPGEVSGLILSTGGAALSWAEPAPAGSLTHGYDVIRALDTLEDFAGPATCVVSDASVPSAQDPEDPPYVGAVFYYLVRARNSCGAGPAHFDSEGASRPVRSCP